MTEKLQQILILDPQSELHFNGPFTGVTTLQLKLFNPSERRVCFKVKTTAPKRYCVRPNSGLLEPKQTVHVAIMLQPFDYDPSEKNKHKFMVQTMFAPEGDVNLETLWKEANTENLMDSKLRCVFHLPSDSTTPNNLDTSTVGQADETTPVTKITPDPSPKPSPKYVDKEKATYETEQYTDDKVICMKTSNVIVDGELRKYQEECKRLKDDIIQLQQENSKLQEESLRQRGCRSTVGGETHSSLKTSPRLAHPTGSPTTSCQESQQIQQNYIIYIGIVFGGYLLGLIFGKFLL
ncbi:vesicle-associated membrane protein-associated protein B-like [Limulus polyphemus]|uniref:Vesicle-associated membrane protein-associated protein B-like n=1 Tax=Limulus polyphemus TaxID=6850 RepID=A0ABM1BVI0_LIMPO|nr:vesicle-associated membrane protein-associated protein B-like [Limulus polyphemus]